MAITGAKRNANSGANLPDKTKVKCWALCVTSLFVTTIVIVFFNFAVNKTTSRTMSSDDDFTGAYMSSPPQPPEKDPKVVLSTPLGKWHNVLVNETETYTSTMANELRIREENVSECVGVRTNKMQVHNLPDIVNGMPTFQADRVYWLTIDSFEENGNRRCAGGDYYEVDLHQKDPSSYRSRLPTVDFLNGSYGLEFIVPSQFSGEFVLDIWILFTDWHGMDWIDYGPRNFSLVFMQELRVVASDDYVIMAQNSWQLASSSSKQIKKCGLKDFDRPTWHGRWTRGWFNDSCEADNQVRFRCLPEEHYQCEPPWCHGPLGRLESNGWSYSAHCSFKIFERDEAWKCLDGRWFFTWGDSNFQDTIRNMLLFVLEWELPPKAKLADYEMDRTFDSGFVNPARKDQMFKVSQLFNGAHDADGGGEGIHSLTYKEYQDHLLSIFNTNRTRLPDTIVMNSGLHDGVHYSGVEDYSAAVDFTIQWWVQLYESLPANQRPLLIWRTTIAPAGPQSRLMRSNPHKMEVYNLVVVEKLQRARDEHKLPVKFIDFFDMTFPFHYDWQYSDGGHYGRPPGTDHIPWFKAPHWYFVDLMLCHMILNIVCADQV